MASTNLLFSFLIMYAGFAGKSVTASAQSPAKHSEDSITYQIFNAAGNNFGYDIFKNKKLLIHQPTIPGLPGNKGFTWKIDAENIAILVVKKIKHGMMPPTVESRELDSLKIKY